MSIFVHFTTDTTSLWFYSANMARP